MDTLTTSDIDCILMNLMPGPQPPQMNELIKKLHRMLDDMTTAPTAPRVAGEEG